MKIKDYLASLGNTEEQVVFNLCKDGIRGQKKSPSACPIIRGIQKNCFENPFVKYLKANAPGCLTWNDVQVLDPFCPEPVTIFMNNFDQGMYPSLED